MGKKKDAGLKLNVIVVRIPPDEWDPEPLLRLAYWDFSKPKEDD